MRKDCIFCQVVTGKQPGTFIYQDEHVVVIKDIHPQAPVHWLVIPKKHVGELTEADDALLLHMLAVIKRIIKERKIIQYRIVNNSKASAFIDHLHIHVLGSVDKFRQL